LTGSCRLRNRQHDPRHDVGDQPDAGRQEQQGHPDQAHDGGIHVEILGKPGADAGYLLIRPDAPKFSWRLGGVRPSVVGRVIRRRGVRSGGGRSVLSWTGRRVLSWTGRRPYGLPAGYAESCRIVEPRATLRAEHICQYVSTVFPVQLQHVQFTTCTCRSGRLTASAQARPEDIRQAGR